MTYLTYAALEKLGKRGRGGKKALKRKLYAVHMPDRIDITWYDTIIAKVAPDDTVTLLLGKSKNSQSVQGYITWMMNGFLWFAGDDRWYIRGDATTFRAHKERVRVSAPDSDWANAIPYIDGLKLRHDKILNPEIAVDEVKSLNTEKAAEIRKTLTRLRKLVLASFKLGAEIPALLAWQKRREVKARTLAELAINIEDPSNEDVKKIMELGAAHTDMWSYRKQPLAPKELQRAVDNGLAALRKKMYIEAGLYTYEVSTPQEERECT